jgi:hypothetical protein
MQCEELSESHRAVDWLEVDTVSAGLHMDRDEGRQLAVWLRDEGWLHLVFGVGSPKLQLTLHGRREIVKLHKPRWYRWLDKHPAITSALVSGSISLGFFILTKLLQRWFGF